MSFQAHYDIAGYLGIAVKLILCQIEPHKVRWALAEFLADLSTEALHAVIAEIDVFNRSLVKELQYLSIELISDAIPGQVDCSHAWQLFNSVV